MNEVLT